MDFYTQYMIKSGRSFSFLCNTQSPETIKYIVLVFILLQQVVLKNN